MKTNHTHAITVTKSSYSTADLNPAAIVSLDKSDVSEGTTKCITGFYRANVMRRTPTGRIFFASTYKCQQKKCRRTNGFRSLPGSRLRLSVASDGEVSSARRRLAQRIFGPDHRAIRRPPCKRWDPGLLENCNKNRNQVAATGVSSRETGQKTRKRGMDHVLQSMWSTSWNAAALPELRRTHGCCRCHAAVRSRVRSASLPSGGAAGGFACHPASAHSGYSVDSFRRLFRASLAAGTPVSSHSIRRRQMDERLRCVDDDVALPSRRMAPPLHHRHRICAGHPVSRCRAGLADAPALGPHLRYCRGCADPDQALLGHHPGNLYPLGPAGMLGGPELRATVRGTSRVPTPWAANHVTHPAGSVAHSSRFLA